MTILCYHNVAPTSSATLTMPADDFAAQCDWLSAHRRVVDLSNASDRLDGKFRPPAGTVAITFDDGWAGVYDHAWPILRERNLPFTIFVIAETLIDDSVPRDWLDDRAASDMAMLTLDQVREMHDSGVGVGSHSMRHDDLRTLGPDECERDLRESRELLEDLLQTDVPTLAYPKGDHDASVRAAAERAGYAAAYSLPETREPVGRFAIPRVGVYPGNTERDLRIKTHPRYLDLRLNPAQQIAKRLKSALRI